MKKHYFATNLSMYLLVLYLESTLLPLYQSSSLDKHDKFGHNNTHHQLPMVHSKIQQYSSH